MLVWLLVNKESLKYKIDSFVAAGQAAGHTVELVGAEEFALGVRGTQVVVLKDGTTTQLPDVAISIAMHRSKNQFENEILLALEKSGVHVINTFASRVIANNKFRTLQVFAEHGIPLPKAVLFDPEQPLVGDLEFSYPVILKPLDASKGVGVLLCKSGRELESVTSLLRASAKPGATFLIQEFIASSKARDVRVMVLGDQVLGAMLRTGAPESITANFSTGGSVAPYELDEQGAQLALAAARAAGLEYAGVDLLFGENGFVVCEVNANPGFSGFTEATGIDVPRKIFEYLKASHATH